VKKKGRKNGSGRKSCCNKKAGTGYTCKGKNKKAIVVHALYS
jgi:hypothetical protein